MTSSHSPHDDVLEKSYGDLIDIPRNEPTIHPEPPKHTDKDCDLLGGREFSGDYAPSTGSTNNTMNSFDLLGDVVHEDESDSLRTLGKKEYEEEYAPSTTRSFVLDDVVVSEVEAEDPKQDNQGPPAYDAPHYPAPRYDTPHYDQPRQEPQYQETSHFDSKHQEAGHREVQHEPHQQDTQQSNVYGHYHNARDEAPFEPVGRGGVPLDHLIEDQVAEVHDDVQEVLKRMQETDEQKLDEPKEDKRTYDEEKYGFAHRPPEDSDSDQPDFRHQTPEAEESTFNRRGPLTIPELSEKVPTPSDHGDHAEVEHPDYSPHHGGFATHPRPPTPPKDISEEDVKPSAFSLAHTTPTHSQRETPHSILKQSISYGSGEPWFDFKTVDPKLLDLLYWRDPRKSGVALSLTLLVVFILAKYPILTVLSHGGLAVLAGTLGFRIYKAIEAQVKKTGAENPFQEYLSKDLRLPQERVHAQVDVLAEHGTQLANQLKRLVFVENIVDSVKFGLILWALTYIGYWFSGLALVVMAVLGAFSVPKIYEMYKEPIDAQLNKASEHMKKASKIAEDKLPFLKKGQVEVEKKEE